MLGWSDMCVSRRVASWMVWSWMDLELAGAGEVLVNQD